MDEQITELFWEGIARIDNTVDDYVSNISIEGDTKRLHVKDVKYHHRGMGIDLRKYTPYAEGKGVFVGLNTISIWVRGKVLQNYMECKVIMQSEVKEWQRGLIKKETIRQKIVKAKGLVLESCSPSENNFPCLASYRANIGGDNDFRVEQEGITCFYSMSKSAEWNAARQSITCVFVASNDKPFVAYVRKKGKIFKMICDSNGIREESEDKEDETESKKVKQKNDPLHMLKLRLAKGEITKKEYEELRQVLEIG